MNLAKIKKIVKTKLDIDAKIIEHIIKGDRGDSVPSVLCPDNFFVDTNKIGRAPSVTKAVIAKYSNRENLTEEEKKRYDRNEELVSFTKIPDYIEERILNEFTQDLVKNGRGKIFNYLVKNKMNLFFDQIEDF